MVHPFQRSCNLDDSYDWEGRLTDGNEEPYTMLYQVVAYWGNEFGRTKILTQSICRNGAT
jgi:hypothetical protein